MYVQIVYSSTGMFDCQSRPSFICVRACGVLSVPIGILFSSLPTTGYTGCALQPPTYINAILIPQKRRVTASGFDTSTGMVVVPKIHRGKFVLFLVPRPDISLTLSLSLFYLPLPPLVAYVALFCFVLSACQAMVAADQWFMKEAEASTRAGSSWEFAAVRNSLQVHTYLRAQCCCCTASPVQSCASFPSEREITDASVIFFVWRFVVSPCLLCPVL